MKNVLMVLVLSSCVGYIFGSQHQQIVLTAYVHSSLSYMTVENVQDFTVFNLEIKPNDPCLSMMFKHPHQHITNFIWVDGYGLMDKNFPTQKTLEIARVYDNLKQNLLYIPLRYVLTSDAQNFKRKGEVLFSFTRELENKPCEFMVQLDKDFTTTSATAIQDFRSFPLIGGRGDYAKDKKALIDQGILAENRLVLIHGPNSYFGDSVIKEEEERMLALLEQINREQAEEKEIRKAEESRDFYRIMVPIAIMGIALIAVPMLAAYVLYKKHHATVGK